MYSSVFTILIHACLLFDLVKFSLSGPIDAIALACGASNEATDADNRKWEPDNKYLPSTEKSQSVRAQLQDPSLPSEVPYMTARIINTEITYKFPINSSSR